MHSMNSYSVVWLDFPPQQFIAFPGLFFFSRNQYDCGIGLRSHQTETHQTDTESFSVFLAGEVVRKEGGHPTSLWSGLELVRVSVRDRSGS